MNINHKKLINFSLAAVLVVLFNFSVIASALAYSPEEIIVQTNESRAQSGLSELKENKKLDLAALDKAQDMLKNGYFAHFSPNNKSPWDFIIVSGYNYNYAGENLAIGYIDRVELMQAWLNSPTHKANILNKDFTEIGVAVLKGKFKGEENTVVVQMFGQETNTVLANNNLTNQIKVDSTKQASLSKPLENTTNGHNSLNLVNVFVISGLLVIITLVIIKRILPTQRLYLVK
jgi:hypothetical protein